MSVKKRLLMAVGALALFVAGGVAWWLLSPLFISKTVHEEFPRTVSAVIPKPMTRSEAERVMAGMAKIDQKMAEAMPRGAAPAKVKVGAFRDGDSFHKGSGQAAIYRLEGGNYLLRLENLRVTNGPALHVLLSRHPDPQKRADLKEAGYLDLGRLKGNIGDQNYPIPGDVEARAQGSVVIYCKPFQVIFSVAPLRGTPSSS